MRDHWKRGSIATILSLLLVIPWIMAPTGGYPSFMQLQALGVGTLPGSTPGVVTVQGPTNATVSTKAGAAAGFSHIFASGAATSQVGMCTSDTAGACGVGAANDSQFFGSGTIHITTNGGTDRATVDTTGAWQIPATTNGAAVPTMLVMETGVFPAIQAQTNTGQNVTMLAKNNQNLTNQTTSIESCNDIDCVLIGNTGRANSTTVLTGAPAGELGWISTDHLKPFCIGINTQALLCGNASATPQASVSEPNYNEASAMIAVASSHQVTATLTATGIVGSPTGSCIFTREGAQASVRCPAINGTSNATTWTLTGIPAQFATAAGTQRMLADASCQDNGVSLNIPTAACDAIVIGSVIQFNKNGGAWTASGTKGTGAGGFSTSYQIN